MAEKTKQAGRPEKAKSSESFIRVRMAGYMPLWVRFGDAVQQAEPELDRSKVLREFMRYYVGDTDRLPRRPSRAGPTSVPVSGEDQQP